MKKVILYEVYDNDPIYESKIQKDLYELIGHQNFRIIPVSRSSDKFTVFAFLRLNEVTQLTEIFKKYNMLISSRDVTREVIKGEMPSYEHQREFDFVVYRKVLEEFREMNTDVDDVLDIISESGIYHLDDIHKRILENF